MMYYMWILQWPVMWMFFNNLTLKSAERLSNYIYNRDGWFSRSTTIIDENFDICLEDTVIYMATRALILDLD